MALFIEPPASQIAWHPPTTLVVVVLAVVAWQFAYRGVQISAIVMLVLEAISVSIILLLVAIVLRAHGAAIDPDQLRVSGGFPGGIGLAIATAVFSFVGFESATAFGAEAKRPLVTIPRAVIGSVLFATAFFVIATYAEILGLRHASQPLDKQQFPLQIVGRHLWPRLSRRSDYRWGGLQRFLGLPRLHHDRGTDRFCDGSVGTLAARLRAHRTKHDTPNVAVTVVTATALALRSSRSLTASQRSTSSTTAER